MTKKDKKTLAKKIPSPPKSMPTPPDDINASPIGEKEKKYIFRRPFAMVSLLIIFFSSIVLSIALNFNFSKTEIVQLKASRNLIIFITVESSEFLTLKNSSVCSGTRKLPNLSNAQIKISNAKIKWSISVPFGSGVLTSSNSCLYEIRVATPSEFTGGEIQTLVNFSFGSDDEVQKNDLNELPPWIINKNIKLEI